MPRTDPVIQEAAIPFRLYGVEEQVKTLDSSHVLMREGLARTTEAVSLQGATLAAHDEALRHHGGAISEAKADITALAVSIAALAEKVAQSSNRIAWTFATFALTVLGSLIVYLLTSA